MKRVGGIWYSNRSLDIAPKPLPMIKRADEVDAIKTKNWCFTGKLPREWENKMHAGRKYLSKISLKDCSAYYGSREERPVF